MTTPEEIKAWLKQIRKTRAWLAEQCGIGKRSLDNWLSSSKSIPHAQLRLIEHLMHPHDASGRPTPAACLAAVEVLALKFTSDEFAVIAEAAEAMGLSLDDFGRQAINVAAGDAIKQKSEQAATPPAASAAPAYDAEAQSPYA